MKITEKNIPLSLYIHIPWCKRKCPYCDFVSFESGVIPEDKYIQQLIQNLNYFLPFVANRKLISIFIGGGTPSLFSAKSVDCLLNEIRQKIPFSASIEISMEANPGTFDAKKMKAFYSVGINRLSIGIQSFQDEKLKSLGRIHDSTTAARAIEIAKQSHFNNINLDLMFGLPNQTLTDALFDLKTALDFEPQHLSWYQLTIEPETLFAKRKLALPDDDLMFDIHQAGQQLLKENNFHHYETSAFVKQSHVDFRCRHNLNYWQFGDYIGIGLAAHSKLTDFKNQHIHRFHFGTDLSSYFNSSAPTKTNIEKNDLLLETMMNILRLTDGFSMDLLLKRTGLPRETIEPSLNRAIKTGYLTAIDKNQFKPTTLGKNFLNCCLADCFMR